MNIRLNGSFYSGFFPGQIIQRNDDYFVVIDRSLDHDLHKRAVLQGRAEGNYDFYRVLIVNQSDCDEYQVIPLFKVDRIQEADHLKQFENHISIRFKGDYNTKKFARTRFENHKNRVLLDRSNENLVGIYHISDRSLLRASEHDLRNHTMEAYEKITDDDPADFVDLQLDIPDQKFSFLES